MEQILPTEDYSLSLSLSLSVCVCVCVCDRSVFGWRGVVSSCRGGGMFAEDTKSLLNSSRGGTKNHIILIMHSFIGTKRNTTQQKRVYISEWIAIYWLIA